MSLVCANLGAGLKCTWCLLFSQQNGPPSQGAPTEALKCHAMPCHVLADALCPLRLPCSWSLMHPRECLWRSGGWPPLLLALPVPHQLLSHKLPTSGQSLCSLGSALAQETLLYSAICSSSAECAHPELIALASHRSIIIKAVLYNR